MRHTDDALLSCVESITSRSNRRPKGGSSLNSYRSITSSVDGNNMGLISSRSHGSEVWTGRSASYNLSKTKRDYVKEVVDKQWNLREGRTKHEVPHQMNSRLVGSLIFSGHVGNKAFTTENRELLTPKQLSIEEQQDLNSLHRKKGEFSTYLHDSIMKNVNIKATGHAP